MTFLLTYISPRTVTWLTLIAVLSMGFLFAIMPSHSSAALKVDTGLNEIKTTTGLPGEAGGDSLPQLIGTIIKAFLGVLGVIFVILMVYAGGLWMTARGNEEQVTQARDIITRAVIGFVVIVLSYAITTFVINQIVGGVSGVTPSGGTVGK